MSHALVKLAWDATCDNASEKVVLLALADRANADGKCWPGIDDIAARCSLQVRGVKGIIQRLEKSGHITVVRASGIVNKYTVHPCTPCTSAPDAPVHEMHHTRAPDAPVPVHAVHHTRARRAPESVKNLSGEPVMNLSDAFAEQLGRDDQ
ncbi:MAG: helix-turn-helix domain-containing protein [Verrucomicrobia bacterium]|nr:helix-turn-helix domain-containing protein [Verrucomicrobiota bacterium]